MAESSEIPERNIRLLIEYDGRAYSGWQRQTSQPTIQGSIETALSKILGSSPTLHVAGRTDAGVHAIAQVANFTTRSNIKDWQFARGINNFLPRDISVHRSEEVPLNFNSRFNSVSKHYRYRIYHGPQPSALDYGRAWWLLSPVDMDRLEKAASLLVGQHDFNAFRSAHCDAEHAIREIYSIKINKTPRPPVGYYVDIIFHANAFCRHMCRILAGTIIETALGKLELSNIEEALEKKDREYGGVTAPPGGLTLLEVVYPPENQS
jgi:tRNA pseudouridine38-40 synthase